MFSSFIPDIRDKELDDKREEISTKLDEIINLIEIVSPGENGNVAKKIEEVKEHLFNIVNLYSISPGSYPGFKNNWQGHFLKLDRDLNNVLRSNDNDFDKNTRALIKNISEYYVVIKEQFINLGIESIYHGIFDTALFPSFSSTEIDEKLAGAFKILDEFTHHLKLIKNMSKEGLNNLLKLQLSFKWIEKNVTLSNEVSTYFILIASWLNNDHNIGGLDENAALGIAYTMGNVIKALENRNDQIIKPRPQDQLFPAGNLNDSAAEIDKEITNILFRISTKYFNHYGHQLDIQSCVLSSKIYGSIRRFYLETPKDYPGLFDLMLKDAMKLRYTFKVLDGKHFAIEAYNKALKEFSQKMTGYYLEVLICDLYNSICFDISSNQKGEGPFYIERWKHSFDSLMYAIDAIFEKIKKMSIEISEDEREIKDSYLNVMQKLTRLKDKFITLNSAILIDDINLAIASARKCIIGLDFFFVFDLAEIDEMKPQILEKIIDRIDCMQTNLSEWVNTSFADEKYFPRRMQMEATKGVFDVAQVFTDEMDCASMHEVNQLSVVTTLMTNTDSAETTEIVPLPMEIISEKNNEDYLMLENDTIIAAIEDSFLEKIASKERYITPFSFFTESSPAKVLRIKAERDYDLICKDVPGNGSCLFSAIALALDLPSQPDYAKLTLREIAKQLRTLANNYIKDNPDEFMDFIEEVKIVSPVIKKSSENAVHEQQVMNETKEYLAEENLIKFVKKADDEREWGDHYHLIALCRSLKLKVFVLNSDNTPPIITGVPNALHEICLGYEVNSEGKGMHYQALVPKDKSQLLPPQVRALINSEKADLIRPSIPSQNLRSSK